MEKIQLNERKRKIHYKEVEEECSNYNKMLLESKIFYPTEIARSIDCSLINEKVEIIKS